MTELRTFNNHTYRTLNAKCRDDGSVVVLLTSGRDGYPHQNINYPRMAGLPEPVRQ